MRNRADHFALTGAHALEDGFQCGNEVVDSPEVSGLEQKPRSARSICA